MSTTITSENGIELEVCSLGIAVVNHEEQTETWARLTDVQRVELAAALDPGRRGLHVRLDNQAATLATYRRECDEALRKKGEAFDRAVRAERERDAAVARAEQAEMERERADCEREETADQFATFRAEIVAEAVKARASAVTRADIEKAILSRRWGTSGPDSQGFDIIHIRSAVDAVCDLLGVEAEQAVDPVESRARELYRAATPDARWETVADEYRRIAAHVLGQEAGDE